MLTVKVPCAEAQAMKEYLSKQKLLAKEYRIVREEGYLYFPVTKKFTGKAVFVEREVLSRPKKRLTLREALLDVLPNEVAMRVKTSYDQVGDIAILEIDDEFKLYERIIGETLLKTNLKVKTVLAKDSSHEGTFRTQHMRLLAGENKRVALHAENGVRLRVDVENVYFSARLATERKRIADLVQPGEEVLVCFSGLGPYTCVLGKHTSAKRVVGIEINPKGHELAEENIRLNKLTNVTNYCGDVRLVIPSLVAAGERFDRVLMPLPKSAETFLHAIMPVLKNPATIHFYAFLSEEHFEEAKGWIVQAAKDAGLHATIFGLTLCGQQAPGVFRICIDAAIFE